MARVMDASSIALVAPRLGISAEIVAHRDWPLALARVSAVATLPGMDHEYSGHGVGENADEAAARAIMECVERYAQFRPDPPPPDAVGSWNHVQRSALAPTAFGLYDASQYAMPDAPFRPFSESEPLEWRYVTDAVDGQRRLVPTELIYPRAPLGRQPLVLETSSGTAAHTADDSASLGAVCELIERDSLMLFWHRQPETPVIPASELPFPELRDEISRMGGMGYVMIVANLDYDLGVPCFLVLGLRGSDFVYGAGCHTDAERALTHAVAEAGQAMVWADAERDLTPVHRTFASVRTPEDHYRLYHRGPYHEVLRQMLARTLKPVLPKVLSSMFTRASLCDSAALASVVGALSLRRLRPYLIDITPREARDGGLRVMRALVPGLIPLHFGFSRMRLGNRRLVGSDTPARFCNMLPHFVR